MRAERTGVRDALLGAAASALAGLLVGVLGTFKHQVGVSAATGTGLPLGLAASVVMLVLLLAALRLSFPTRLHALAAGVGAVVAVVVLLLPGPGGSQVILLNYAGLAWTVAPFVVTAVVVGWPRRTRKAQRAGGILGDRPRGDRLK